MSDGLPEVYDLIILGGGPSGLAAAMYAGRAAMSVLLIDKGALGGMCNMTEKIDNYPGYPDGIAGSELAMAFEKHVRKYVPENRIIFDVVTSLTVSPEDHCVKFIGTDSQSYRAHSVIIATGSTPKPLPIEDHNKWLGRGLSYCAVCDGAFYKGKPVLVVGGGNAAIEEGMFLTRFASKVTVIHRRDELRATPIVQEEAFATPGMEFAWNSVVVSLHGEPTLQEVKIVDVKTGEQRRIPANGLFVYIGSSPNSDFVKIKGLQMDESGYFITDENMCVGIPGLFATGDIRAFPLRQITISCGNGAVAALMAERYLHDLKRRGLYCGISA